MTVWDTFLFGDELDMLECRLIELEQYPDVRHVLVEAPLDHQGNAKPLYYQEHRERFAPWENRIIGVVADLPAAAHDPWDREHIQREHVWAGLDEADPDDLVLLCDVDEIPSARALAATRPGLSTLVMNVSMFAVDWVLPVPQEIAVAAPRKALGSPLWMARDNGYRKRFPHTDDAGWHFSWLGGRAAIERKARQFCHLELQEMILEGNAAGEWYEQGWTWYGEHWTHHGQTPARRQVQMVAETVDARWPRYIRERRCPPSWFRPC
jgi:hypothetical protein